MAGAHSNTGAASDRYDLAVSPSREAARRRTRGKRIARGIVKTVLVLLVLVIVAVGAFGYTQYKAVMSTVDALKADASEVMIQINALQEQATSKDFEAARKTTHDLKTVVSHMQRILSAEEFDNVRRIPYFGEKYGGDIATARRMLDILEELCDDAVSPLLQSLIDNPISGLYSKSEGINMPALYALLDTIDPIIPLVQEKIDEFSALPEFAIPQLKNMMQPALEKVDSIKTLLQSYSSTFANLKSIAHAFLGDDGNKTYMIVAQNSAEMRSTGGFPGSIGLLTITNGKPSVSGFGSVTDKFVTLVTEDYGITDLDMQFTYDRVEYTRGAGYFPDYCRAAAIWARAYEEKTGTHVDGVISLTPSTVQHVLAYAGSIKLSDGTELNGSNATKVLLSDLYWRYLQTYWEIRRNTKYVDDLFAEAAQKSFAKFMDSVDMSHLQDLLDLAMLCIDKREALIWMVDEDDQAAIASLHCSGIENRDPTNPVMGVFFNTFVASKTAWYLDQTIEIGEGVRNADGTTSYPVTVTWANIMTAEQGRKGGTYIMGSGQEVFSYMQNGYMKPIIYLWAPCGGTISDITDNKGITWTDIVYEGNQLWYEFDAIIAPQDSFVVTYTVTVPAEATSPLTYWTQPTLTEYR